MTKEFRKAVYTRSRLKNKMNKNRTKKKQRLIEDNETCVSLRRKNLFSIILQKRASLQIKTFRLPSSHF